MRKITTALSLSFLLAAGLTTAQETKKPLSPPAKAEATIKGKAVTIDYGAPSRRERVIMGGLVPYGKVWRTGANAATTLTTAADLMIGNLHVPAGKYALLTIPGENEWTLIVSKQTDLRGSSNYDEKQDLGRVKMDVKKLKDTVETFKIGIDDRALSLTWENTTAWVPVMVH
jgi:hypothetical protein